MTKRETAKRQAWMATYESELVKRVPEWTGKVDWNSAIYFYNSGRDPIEAAMYMAFRKAEHEESNNG